MDLLAEPASVGSCILHEHAIRARLDSWAITAKGSSVDTGGGGLILREAKELVFGYRVGTLCRSRRAHLLSNVFYLHLGAMVEVGV